MLSKERLAYILQRINEDASVRGSVIAKETGTSLSTIKRDLIKLENEGLIKRERGGAVSNNLASFLKSSNEQSVVSKINDFTKEKQRIAKIAAKEINDHDIIFVDSGSTIYEMAPYIADRDITIITNSVFFVKNLVDHKAKVILLGGEYNEKYQMLCGATTFIEIEQIRFDKAFISCNGLNAESEEIYTVDRDNGALKELVVKRSEVSYLLMDASKFSVSAAYCFARADNFKKIFTSNNKKIKGKTLFTLC